MRREDTGIIIYSSHKSCFRVATTCTMAIEAGTVVRIHSLKSAAGQKLNGQRALVIQLVENGTRWQVRVEQEVLDDDTNMALGTKAIKEANLRPIPRLKLPTGMQRGFGDPMHDMDECVRKMCELLLYYKDDFRPSEIMFMGYGAQAFMRMGQTNFGCFCAIQMEQMGGVLALVCNIVFVCNEMDAARKVFLIIVLSSITHHLQHAGKYMQRRRRIGNGGCSFCSAGR